MSKSSEAARPFSKAAEELIAAFRKLPTDEPTEMRKRPTKELGELIRDLTIKHGIGVLDSPEAVVRENWLSIVGAANATYSHAAQIDARGRLTILAGHSVVRNELFMHRRDIIVKLQKLPGCAHIRDIFLRPA